MYLGLDKRRKKNNRLRFNAIIFLQKTRNGKRTIGIGIIQITQKDNFSLMHLCKSNKFYIHMPFSSSQC